MSIEINPFKNIEIKISESGFDKVDATWHKFVAYFPYYRMYYIKSGDAKMYLQNSVLDLKPDHIYFVPPFSVIDAQCNEILLHYWVHFRLDITTENYLAVYPQMASDLVAVDGDERAFRIIYDSMHQECNSPAAELAKDGMARYLISRFLEPHSNKTDRDSLRFLPVLKYIDTHLTEKISNAELGSIMYVGPTYFSNIFSEKFNLPPKQYILQKRMSAAATLLLESNKSVKEIAYAVGFDNEAYFNRLFQKTTGFPPGKYRKQASK